MRWRLAVFLCTFAGFALAACAAPRKDGSDYKQKVDVVKRPYQPPAPEPTPTSIDPDGGPPSDPIYFDFDAYTVRADSRPVLERYADYLNKHARATVTISGHTDERGTTEYNLALGDERAKAARDYLVRMGVDASRIKVISFGEERPADGASGEEGWSKNRRAEFDTRR